MPDGHEDAITQKLPTFKNASLAPDVTQAVQLVEVISQAEQ